jgi:hypothetical protein
MFPAKFVFKLLVYLVIVVVFVVSLQVVIRRHELSLIQEFQSLAKVDPIPGAKRLAEAGKICEALEYLDLFKDFEYVKTNPKFASVYKEIEDERNSYFFFSKQLLNGIWWGQGDCPEAVVSATITDFLVVGDVRDLILEETKRWKGEDPDEFTEALSAVGLIMAGVTVVSGGGAAPAKGTLSVLKAAKKMGKLPRPLEKALIGMFRRAAKTGNLKEVRVLSKNLYKVVRVPHYRKNLFYVISRSNNVKDLARLEKMASVYGKNTVKFLKLGGGAPARVLKKFGNNKTLVKAMDEAVQYGPRGTRLIEKTGPTKFLKYVRLTKYGARTTRSIYQQRLTSLLGWILNKLPMESIYAICALTGLVAVGVPMSYLFRIGRRLRRSPEAG